MPATQHRSSFDSISYGSGIRHWHVRTLGCGDFKTSIFEPSADCVYNKRVIVNDENARHDGRISMLKFVFPTDPSN
jgi:hypothetical protein